MAIRICKTTDLTRDKWLEKRKDYIGASEASAAMGLSKWKSRRKLFRIKKGLEEENKNLRMQLGLMMEPIVAKVFTDRTGLKIRRKNYILGHAKYKFMSCNLDYIIVGENVPCEIKTCGDISLHRWGNDNVPDDYFWQCQQQIEVTGAKYCYLAVLFTAMGDFKSFKIQRNDQAIRVMIDLEEEFWYKYLTKNIEPPVSYQDHDDLNKEYSNKIYDPIDLNTKEMTDFLNRRTELKKIKQKTDIEIKTIDANIKNAIGDHTHGLCGETKISWKKQDVGRIECFDEQSFKSDNPKLYLKYLREKEIKTREYFRVA